MSDEVTNNANVAEVANTTQNATPSGEGAQNPSTEAMDNATGENAPATNAANEQPTDQADAKSEQLAINPESFTLPEGFTLDQKLMDKFLPKSIELGFNQAQAQAMVDLHTEIATEMQNKFGEAVKAEVDATFNQRADEWEAEIKADPLFNEQNKASSIASIAKAKDAFKGMDINLDDLFKTEYGNHPELAKAFVKIGEMVGDDNRLVGGGSVQKEPSQNEIIKIINQGTR